MDSLLARFGYTSHGDDQYAPLTTTPFCRSLVSLVWITKVSSLQFGMAAQPIGPNKQINQKDRQLLSKKGVLLDLTAPLICVLFGLAKAYIHTDTRCIFRVGQNRISPFQIPYIPYVFRYVP